MANPWEPEIEFTQEWARELITSQFPELGPVTLKAFGVGWDNVALLVNDTWVFRFPQREFARDGMRFETVCLQHMPDSLPLTVPNPVFVGRPLGSYPFPFSGYRLLPGTTACSRELDDETRGANAALLGSFLRELHGMPITPELARDLPGDLIRRSDLGYRVNSLRSGLDVLEAQGEVFEFARLREAASRFAAAPAWSRELCVVHGDLYARHLLIDEAGRLSGVIDWGDVHRGDPALDLSIEFAFLPAAARAEFEASYGPIDDATRDRARFRAMYSTVMLVKYGTSVGDDAIASAGRWGLQRVLD